MKYFLISLSVFWAFTLWIYFWAKQQKDSFGAGPLVVLSLFVSVVLTGIYLALVIWAGRLW